MYGIGIRFHNRTPDEREKQAQFKSPSKESLIMEKKLFMIECKIEILNLQLSSPSPNNDNQQSTTLSMMERIKYYSDQLEEAKKIVIMEDEKFVNLLIQEDNVEELERLKIKVLDP